MINFLTGHESNNRFYSLTPNFVETFEDKIIEDIKLKQHDYVFITNQETVDYGFAFFGKNYGKSIYSYILNNYELVEKIEIPDMLVEHLWVEIYKIKD